MCDSIRDACLCDCRYRVSTTDDNNSSPIGSLCNGVCNTYCSLIKRWFLKDTHGSIPNDHPCICKRFRKMANGLDTDIQSHQTDISELNWNCLSYNLLSFDWFITVHYLMIGR